MDKHHDNDQPDEPLATRSAYLDYCVKQGWLIKSGAGEQATYSVTPLGEKKLADAPLNFDLSKVTRMADQPKRKRRSRRK